jgi:hypothetical protein
LISNPSRYGAGAGSKVKVGYFRIIFTVCASMTSTTVIHLIVEAL